MADRKSARSRGAGKVAAETSLKSGAETGAEPAAEAQTDAPSEAQPDTRAAEAPAPAARPRSANVTHVAQGQPGKATGAPRGRAVAPSASAPAEPESEPAPKRDPGNAELIRKRKEEIQRQRLAEQRARQAERKAEREAQLPGGKPVIKPDPERSKLRHRHWIVAFAFLYMVAVPIGATAWYLWDRAIDRYSSVAGLSIRTQEVSSAIELLGGVAELGGGSSSDVDILHQYLQSQEMVARIDELIDLRSIWSDADIERDPIYVYHAPGTIEDLVDYWGRMVDVYKDSSTGLLNIEAQAFSPEDAQLIARTIVSESSLMINRLAYDAQQDATRYAREELDLTQERLREAREALTRFRNEHQLVDPAASIQSQMGILSELQSQLANTLIEVDLLRQTAGETDPRLEQAQRRIDVIQLRIAEERAKLGIGGATGDENSDLFADLVGEYEGLAVDLHFAEQSYTAARAAYDGAVAESQRQSRYLATHVRPTLAERAEYPQRFTILALIGFFAFLLWAIFVLAFYSFKDRR
ncbi:capsule biosynthesis protein [Pseudoroseicyclus sp. CXY001]|uniref:capsule biosynthesis protein n=1 Tax=Pseudoroseicyclus sp. CXY001 TaxID=3242492 RepID=UPI0035710525